MGMYGQKILERLGRLSASEKMKDVKSLSHALYPGYHCPLMGAMLTVNRIRDSVLMVLGPDECSYYTKMATGGSGSLAADGCRVVSCVLDHHDVTFGARESLEEAFQELAEEYRPRAVFLVSTCVPEITGDDVEALAALAEKKHGFPVMVVHAENFKTDDHLPGMERTMAAAVKLMEVREKTMTVNVLGLRLGDFTKTECCRFLGEAGVGLGMMLPGPCSVEEIQKAPAARVNLVVHPIGLPLARGMQERFGTPYVFFERLSDPERILKAYQALFEAMGLPLPFEIQTLYDQAASRTEEARRILAGGSYFSGNTALCNYELHAFLCEKLGLKPLLLQISDLDDISRPYREILLQYADPYVSRAANLGALKYLYPVLKPTYNLGAGNPMEMLAAGTAMVSMMRAYNVLGFETNQMVCEAFLAADSQRQAFLARRKGGQK